MRGLLYKEIGGLLRLYKKNLLLVALLYGVMAMMMNNDFFLYFGIWMMGFYSLSGFSLDEQSGWGRYARTLPISDRQVVGAKFLASLAFIGIGVVYGLAVSGLCGLVSGDYRLGETLATVMLVAAVALLSVAVMFLLAIKFGPEKARNYFLVFYMAGFLLFFLAAKTGVLESPSQGQLLSVVTWLEAHMLLAGVLALALAALIMLACYSVSCAIYSKKEF